MPHWTDFLEHFRGNSVTSYQIHDLNRISREIEYLKKTRDEIDSAIEKEVLKEYSDKEIEVAKTRFHANM